MDRAVEATRDQDQVWLELAGDGEKKFVAGVFVLIAPKVSHFVHVSVSLVCHMTSFPSHVDIEPSTWTFSNVV